MEGVRTDAEVPHLQAGAQRRDPKILQRVQPRPWEAGAGHDRFTRKNDRTKTTPARALGQPPHSFCSSWMLSATIPTSWSTSSGLMLSGGASRSTVPLT